MLSFKHIESDNQFDNSTDNQFDRSKKQYETLEVLWGSSAHGFTRFVGWTKPMGPCQGEL